MHKNKWIATTFVSSTLSKCRINVTKEMEKERNEKN
jgi:hypothetical protein